MFLIFTEELNFVFLGDAPGRRPGETPRGDAPETPRGDAPETPRGDAPVKPVISRRGEETLVHHLLNGKRREVVEIW